MRKIIILTVTLFALLFIVIDVYVTNKEIDNFIKQKSQEIYLKNKKLFEERTSQKAIFLRGIAEYFSTSTPVIKGYLDNNRSEIINFVKPLYDYYYLHNFLYEVHFFKKPVISFVNFGNLKVYDVNVSKARRDILWVNKTFTPSVHFYVCRVYPGFRATYPIIYKDRLLGSVSIGMHINNLYKRFFSSISDGCFILYNNKLLKKFLIPKKYTYFSKLPLYKGFRVDGELIPIKISNGVEIKNDIVFSKFEIKDMFDNLMAIVVIKDDIQEALNFYKRNIYLNMFIQIGMVIFIILLTYYLFEKIFKNIDYMMDLLTKIEQQKFDELPKEIKGNGEYIIMEKKIVETGRTLQKVINILQSKMEDYYKKAYVDALTNVLNRRFLEEKANELFFKYKLQNIPVGVIMLDIDDFKKINDTYGHDAGDLVLVKLAKTIKNLLRKDDFVIRYGGEEFLIILPEADIENTYKIAEKIRKDVEKLILKPYDIKFTVSLGIAEINFREDSSLFEVIKRADKNLYKAKKSGKNKTVL